MLPYARRTYGVTVPYARLVNLSLLSLSPALSDWTVPCAVQHQNLVHLWRTNYVAALWYGLKDEQFHYCFLLLHFLLPSFMGTRWVTPQQDGLHPNEQMSVSHSKMTSLPETEFKGGMYPYEREAVYEQHIAVRPGRQGESMKQSGLINKPLCGCMCACLCVCPMCIVPPHVALISAFFCVPPIFYPSQRLVTTEDVSLVENKSIFSDLYSVFRLFCFSLHHCGPKYLIA